MDTIANSVKRFAGGGTAKIAGGAQEQGRPAYPDLTARRRVKRRSQANIAAFLASTGIELGYDEFGYRSVIWQAGREEVLDDATAGSLWLQACRAGLEAPRTYFDATLRDMARRNGFHPLRQYLDGLEWDGIRRLDTWLHDYLGAVDPAPVQPRAIAGACPVCGTCQKDRGVTAEAMHELVQQYGRKTLIGAARRARGGGTAHNTILVLQAPQGWGKSSAIRALCPREEYFSDRLDIGAPPRKVLEVTAGKWLVELAGFPGAIPCDASAVEYMLCSNQDTARTAYRGITQRWRQFVLFGSTAEERYLRGATGFGHFWTVRVGRPGSNGKAAAELARVRDQLWAEADLRARCGEGSSLEPRLWAAATAEQESRRIPSVWTPEGVPCF